MKNQTKKTASGRDWTRRHEAKARAISLRNARHNKSERHAFALALA